MLFKLKVVSFLVTENNTDKMTLKLQKMKFSLQLNKYNNCDLKSLEQNVLCYKKQHI